MKKSMSRVLVVVVALAAVLSMFSIVDAQTYAPEDPTPAPLRGSTFEPPVATANTGALGFESLNPIAGDGPAAGGTGGGLAITGSETDVPLAIGVALLALGGTALVASRKRDE